VTEEPIDQQPQEPAEPPGLRPARQIQERSAQMHAAMRGEVDETANAQAILRGTQHR